MDNREVWRGRVEAWRASGQGPADYCRGKGFTPSALGYWVKKFAREEATATSLKAPRIARVVRAPRREGGPPITPTIKPAPAPAAPAAPTASESSVVIEIGAVRVQVGGGVDGERLEAVLVAVARAAARGGAA